MKKNLALLSALVFFLGACSSEISDKDVQKYESALNESIQNGSIQREITSFDKNLKIDIKHFVCKADKAYVECNSPDFSVSSKGKIFFSGKNIKLRTNEIYAENNVSGLISYKDYYTHLFSKHDKLETTLNLEGLKLNDELIKNGIKNTNKDISDEKIAKLLQELIQDGYNFTSTFSITKNKDNFNYDNSFKINNNKENFISVDFNLDFKEKNFETFDKLGIKFDTNKASLNNNYDENFDKNFEILLDESILKNFKLDINLQTNNAFSPYINMAKASLEALQNQSSNEEQNLLYSQVLELINDISKDPLYKLNLALGFKDIPVSDFINLKEESIAKITINGKDFSAILKTINQLSQIGNGNPLNEIYP